MESIIIPPLFCPFTSQINSQAKVVQLHLLDWIQRFNLVQKESARQRFLQADIAKFTAYVFPTADVDSLSLASNWVAWLFLVDDQFDDGVIGTQLKQTEDIMAELVNVLKKTYTSTPFLSPHVQSSIGIASLTDLCQRTFPQSTSNWRKRFIRHAADCFAAACWETHNRIQGTMPDEATYIKKRRDTGAIYLILDLIEIVEDIDIPLHVYNSKVFQDTLDATSNVVCWCNDIYSLNKEKSFGDIHNLVLVAQYVHDFTLTEAINYVSELISNEVKLFLNLEQQVLSIFPMHIQDLQKYLAGMKSGMRGNIDWSIQTKRYSYLEKTVSGETANYLEDILSTTKAMDLPNTKV